MAIELKVPDVGESITEVMIGEWLKKVGDSVDQDEIVVIIETDKVNVELPAPQAGTITEILKDDGEEASVGDVIGMMEAGEAGAKAEKKTATKAEAKKTEEPAKAKKTKADEETDDKAETKKAETKKAETKKAPTKAEEPAEETAAEEGDAKGGESAEEARIMPAARRLLAEAGIDASEVEATGPGGRLLKEDVQRHLEARGDEAPAEKTPAKPAKTAEPVKSAPKPARPATGGAREEEVVPMSPLRRRVAERLLAAQQNAAILTTFNEIDMSAVIDLRKRYRESFQKKYEIKLGFMSFFVKAAIEALKAVPQVNAEIRDTDVVYRNYFDVGIAVGGGKGLVVPVIRNAERLSFAEVELTIADLAGRARDGKLKLDELQGGTFTITNGGIYGSLLSTPILNPPQSGILGLHKIEERPVAVDGQVVVRPMMYVALSYDHRIVDGREAVTFLVKVKETIEDPARILLEV